MKITNNVLTMESRSNYAFGKVLGYQFKWSTNGEIVVSGVNDIIADKCKEVIKKNLKDNGFSGIRDFCGLSDDIPSVTSSVTEIDKDAKIAELESRVARLEKLVAMMMNGNTPVADVKEPVVEPVKPVTTPKKAYNNVDFNF